jgi:hypothetical protein
VIVIETRRTLERVKHSLADFQQVKMQKFLLLSIVIGSVWGQNNLDQMFELFQQEQRLSDMNNNVIVVLNNSETVSENNNNNGSDIDIDIEPEFELMDTETDIGTWTTNTSIFSVFALKV